MFELGTKLIRTQTGQHYVIEKKTWEKVKGKLFKKKALYYLKHENGQIGLIVHEDELKSMFKFVKQTNADRIRCMSDEELEEFMSRCELGDIDYSVTFCSLCKKDGNRLGLDCNGCRLHWLQSEVEVADER